MQNLFHSFDPNIEIMAMHLPVNWLSMMIVLLIPSPYWLSSGLMFESVNSFNSMILKEMKANFSYIFPPNGYLLLMSTMCFVFLVNVFGLMPYVFTPTSHFSVTLGMSLTMWAGLFFIQMSKNSNQFFIHMVPESTPSLLMPLMVLIETISYFIRPFTLAIRLAANMVAGHLLLSLLGSQGPSLTGLFLFFLMVGLIMLICLELAVACIQSYVFTILSSLYLSEMVYR